MESVGVSGFYQIDLKNQSVSINIFQCQLWGSRAFCTSRCSVSDKGSEKPRKIHIVWGKGKILNSTPFHSDHASPSFMLKFVSGSRTQLSYGNRGRKWIFASADYTYVSVARSLGNDRVLNSRLTEIRFRWPLVIL